MKMIIVKLGGCDKERHMEEKDVRVARGPEVRAIGSEGGGAWVWLETMTTLLQPQCTCGALWRWRPRCCARIRAVRVGVFRCER